MALVNFKKGTQADYEGNLSTYSTYIYVAEDTRNVYLFGVLQQGISDEIYQKLAAFDNSVLNVINAQKNVANGIAGLDDEGKIDPSLIKGVIGHVLGLENFVTENPTPVEDGKYYFNTTTKKIIEGVDGTWEETDPQSQILYNRRGADDQGRTNVLYRWDGAAMTEVSPSIVIGTVTGTAYDGGQGQANRDALNAMSNTVVTGFGLVTPDATRVTIAFTDADKNTGNNQYAAGDGGNIIIPAATGTAAGMMSAADKAALDKLSGDGEGSLADVVADLAALDAKIGELDSLTTDAKNTIVAAINEVDAHADTAQDAVDALDAAVVKQIKVGTGTAQNPTGGLVTIANATAEADGAMAKEDKAKVDKIINNGDGTQFLANDGTYKTIEMELSEDYAASKSVNLELEPAAGDSYETAISKLHKAILDNEEVTAKAFVNFQTVLGVENPNMTMPDLSDTNYLNGQTQFVAALKALDAALKTVADQAAEISDLEARVLALEQALTLKTVGA